MSTRKAKRRQPLDAEITAIKFVVDTFFELPPKARARFAFYVAKLSLQHRHDRRGCNKAEMAEVRRAEKAIVRSMRADRIEAKLGVGK